jgi:hypothetical protein
MHKREHEGRLKPSHPAATEASHQLKIWSHAKQPEEDNSDQFSFSEKLCVQEAAAAQLSNA